ncbi:hypothetical protein [Gordonia malaquae]|jgi:hypothetical protein|uniref:hypothetical protein n=1 Tax=Gordonia malaquae TaxID=410332 RepID=UPI0030FE7731
MDQSRVVELRYRENLGPDEWDWSESLAIIVTVLIPEFFRRPAVAWSVIIMILMTTVLSPFDGLFALVGFGYLLVGPIVLGLVFLVAVRRVNRKPGQQELVFRENGFSYYGPRAEKLPAEIPYTDVVSLRAYKRATAMRAKHLRGVTLIAGPELMPPEAYNRVYAGMRR